MVSLLNSPSPPPGATLVWRTAESRRFQRRNLSATAWRSSGIPEVAVYFVRPSRIACHAAALM